MPERKTVGQLMEEMRLKAGAQNYHGPEYIDVYKRQIVGCASAHINNHTAHAK